MHKEILLTQGLFAVVDTEDYEYLSQFKWYAAKYQNLFYAQRKVGLTNGKQTTLKMHHVIIGKPPIGYETDHKDGNGLNNRRLNLRHITHRQNTQNMRNIKLTSQFPGVSWRKDRKKWVAHIRIDGKGKNLGSFKGETDAAAAYKEALKNIGEVSVEDL